MSWNNRAHPTHLEQGSLRQWYPHRSSPMYEGHAQDMGMTGLNRVRPVCVADLGPEVTVYRIYDHGWSWLSSSHPDFCGTSFIPRLFQYPDPIFNHKYFVLLSMIIIVANVLEDLSCAKPGQSAFCVLIPLMFLSSL